MWDMITHPCPNLNGGLPKETNENYRNYMYVPYIDTHYVYIYTYIYKIELSAYKEVTFFLLLPILPPRFGLLVHIGNQKTEWT